MSVGWVSFFVAYCTVIFFASAWANALDKIHKLRRELNDTLLRLEIFVKSAEWASSLPKPATKTALRKARRAARDKAK